MVSTASVEKLSGSASRIATSPTARATRRISWARTASIAVIRNSTIGPAMAVATTAAWSAVSPVTKVFRSPPDWFQASATRPLSQRKEAMAATR
ncbi:hypothetical protein CHKEEEPN_3869 [Methylorubrum podarium]|nr:hypothetical protein CHKEEEPN_3869 [Methylorubrum podarium]